MSTCSNLRDLEPAQKEGVIHLPSANPYSHSHTMHINYDTMNLGLRVSLYLTIHFDHFNHFDLIHQSARSAKPSSKVLRGPPGCRACQKSKPLDKLALPQLLWSPVDRNTDALRVKFWRSLSSPHKHIGSLGANVSFSNDSLSTKWCICRCRYRCIYIYIDT